jgi:hypothetical protein
VLSRWQGGLGALIVTLVACALVILDLTDGGLRRWWAERAQALGGEMVRALASTRPGGHGDYSSSRRGTAGRAAG